MRCPVLVSFLMIALVACAGDPSVVYDLQVRIDPETPTTSDDLVVWVEGADAGLPLRLSWLRDGAEAGFTTDTVPSAATAHDQEWTVVAWPEGALRQEGAQASVLIENTPPAVTASITPGSPLVTDDLEVLATSSDADGDPVSLAYAWTRDGSEVDVDGPVVSGDLTRSGERWEVTVTPDDGAAAGEPVVVRVRIDNQAPIVERVDLEPAEIRHGTRVYAAAQGSDPDGDPVTFRFAWYVNGRRIDGETDSYLTADMVYRGDELRAEAVASDWGSDSVPVSSVPVEVRNTPPVASPPTVTSADGLYNGQEARCVPGEARDVDGDSVTLRYQWYVSHRPVTGATDAIWRLDAGRGAVSCGVTPSDGLDAGEEAVSEAADVLNSPPGQPVFRIDPLPPNALDTVEAVMVRASTDVDGDSVSYSYRWSSGTTVVGTRRELDLRGMGLRRGDALTLRVTPNDGRDDGPPALTSTSLRNAPPTPPGRATLEPARPADRDDLVCRVPRISTDADGDSLRYQVYFERTRGSVVKTMFGDRRTYFREDTRDAEDTEVGDRWVCWATVNDGTVSIAGPRSSSVTVR